MDLVAFSGLSLVWCGHSGGCPPDSDCLIVWVSRLGLGACTYHSRCRAPSPATDWEFGIYDRRSMDEMLRGGFPWGHRPSVLLEAERVSGLWSCHRNTVWLSHLFDSVVWSQLSLVGLHCDQIEPWRDWVCHSSWCQLQLRHGWHRCWMVHHPGSSPIWWSFADLLVLWTVFRTLWGRLRFSSCHRHWTWQTWDRVLAPLSVMVEFFAVVLVVVLVGFVLVVVFVCVAVVVGTVMGLVFVIQALVR